MIPKKIHYCWFGGNNLDEKALNCIASWQKHFPDYEIIQWNEQNFDISQMDFMKKAHEDRKWAFVSDVARLILIYTHGGIYFDTDVEVINTYDDILTEDTIGFWGMEATTFVNSGLGFGCVPGNELLYECIEAYANLDYNEHRDNLSAISCPRILTPLLEKKGFIPINQKQTVAGFDIYPSTVFSPIDYETGILKVDESTHSIHWFAASWDDDVSKRNTRNLRLLTRFLGKRLGNMAYGIISCIRNEGFANYCINRIRRFMEKVI